MEHTLISQFIDDELTLDEKEHFVQGVRRDDAFYEETLALLSQERLLGRLDMEAPPVGMAFPMVRQKPPVSRKIPWRPALALAASLLLLALSLVGRPPEPKLQMAHRFLLHAPGVETVAVLGDFTDWAPRSLTPVGEAGYWEVTLTVPEGAHRYAFLIDGQSLAPDPTVVAREQDDFGGMNSILQVKMEDV